MTVQKLRLPAIITVSIISLAALASSALAAPPEGNFRPGWGFGDQNHIHTGPPGQSVRPIAQNNSVSLNQNIVISQNTGGNTGESSITTGAINLVLTISNFINQNILGS